MERNITFLGRRIWQSAETARRGIISHPFAVPGIIWNLSVIQITISMTIIVNEQYILGSLFLSSISSDPYHTNIVINNSKTNFLLYTGAHTNVLSFNIFKKLKLPLKSITKSSHKLSTFSGDVLPVVGQCPVSIQYNNKNF